MATDAQTGDGRRIVRWLRDGNDGLSGKDIRTVQQLLDYGGQALNKACSSEILGEVAFQTDDGLWQVATVELVVDRANAVLIREWLEKAEAKDGTSGQDEAADAVGEGEED
jgi:hypothetical protein